MNFADDQTYRNSHLISLNIKKFSVFCDIDRQGFSKTIETLCRVIELFIEWENTQSYDMVQELRYSNKKSSYIFTNKTKLDEVELVL